jgi:large subunit ribosomal protein L2
MRFRSTLFLKSLGTSSNYGGAIARGKKSFGGRNSEGLITVRGRGGGHKRRYRSLNFCRGRGVVGSLSFLGLEYDPIRSAYIARLGGGERSSEYILYPRNLKIGAELSSGDNVSVKLGNSMPLQCVPLGSFVHNVELKSGRGGQVSRSAGSYAQLIAKDGNFVTLKLPSSEVRLFNKRCFATIGQVGNIEFNSIKFGKAGRKRWLGRRPKVRGIAKNPIDHSHGGGEGRSPIGRVMPVTPWGKPALGPKTRNPIKVSSRYILRARL